MSKFIKNLNHPYLTTTLFVYSFIVNNLAYAQSPQPTSVSINTASDLVNAEKYQPNSLITVEQDITLNSQYNTISTLKNKNNLQLQGKEKNHIVINCENNSCDKQFYRFLNSTQMTITDLTFQNFNHYEKGIINLASNTEATLDKIVITITPAANRMIKIEFGD